MDCERRISTTIKVRSKTKWRGCSPRGAQVQGTTLGSTRRHRMRNLDHGLPRFRVGSEKSLLEHTGPLWLSASTCGYVNFASPQNQRLCGRHTASCEGDPQTPNPTPVLHLMPVSYTHLTLPTNRE